MTYRAIRTARELARRNTPIAEDMCVRHVRLAMEILDGTPDMDHDNDNDAVDAWLRSHQREFVSGDAYRLVRGTWVFFRSRTPGRHGHAAIATGYGRGLDSTVWSPGVPSQPARWRKITTGQLEAGWGLVTVGYAYDLNGHPVPDVERR